MKPSGSVKIRLTISPKSIATPSVRESREQPLAELGEALEITELDRVVPNVSRAPVGLHVFHFEHVKGGVSRRHDGRARALRGAGGAERLGVERREASVIGGSDREMVQ
jgi:hypothetical protein